MRGAGEGGVGQVGQGRTKPCGAGVDVLGTLEMMVVGVASMRTRRGSVAEGGAFVAELPDAEATRAG
jgi:hypothetical protein